MTFLWTSLTTESQQGEESDKKEQVMLNQGCNVVLLINFKESFKERNNLRTTTITNNQVSKERKVTSNFFSLITDYRIKLNHTVLGVVD